MKFTRLRLSGFKSFVDATDLRIEPGLTGIVGPNGCGKSNVVEALRWVMGENSAKSMRGRGMDDVIFSGTGSRSPRNLADVTLTVENDGGTVPSGFADHDVLEVSRRIERDSGSAYRINGKDVRAQDVRLLFADAATGAHSPAMVSQGRIGTLVTSKPADRRAILEEAAGVSGLHTRRKEAEKRLRAAETNLDRVADVIQQLDQRTNSLKRQAKQAAKYRELTDDITKADGALAYLRWRAADQEAMALDREAGDTAASVAELTGAVSSLSREQEAAAEALPALREAESEAAAALQRLTLARDQLEEGERQRQATVERLTSQIADLERDVAREREATGDARAALEKLDEEARRLRDEESAAAETRARAEETLQTVNQAAQAAETDYDQVAGQAADARARKTSLENDLAAAERAAARAEREQATVAEERAEAEADDTSEDELMAADEAVRQAEAALEAAGERLNRAEMDSAAAAESRDSARTALTEAERTHNKVEAERAALADVLAGGDGDDHPAVAERVRVTPGLEKALGAALGDDLEVSESTQAARHWVALPALDGPALPEGAEALAGYVQAPETLQRRLSQVGLVADEAAGTALLAHLRPGQRLVTRDGALWRWDGLVAAADAPSAAAVRLEQRNKLEALEAQAADARAATETAQARHGEAASVARAAQEAEAGARQDRKAAEKDVAAARRRYTEAEREAARRANALSRLAERAERLDGEVQEARSRCETLRSALADLPDAAALEQAVTTAKATVEARRAELAEARAHHQSLSRDAEARQARLKAIAEDRAAWTRRAEKATAHLASLEERLTNTRADLDENAQAPEDLDRQRSALRDRIAEAETARQDAADALAEGDRRKAEADRALKDRETALGDARETHARLQANAENALARRKQLAHDCGERFGCPPTHLPETLGLGEPADLPDEASMESRLDTLKRERDKLGAVNLRAEDELLEVAEQRDHLAGEREDLEAAIGRLRRGIGELNREGRERLVEAFDLVNRHFADLFTTLFGGGKAHLELVDSDDPLEAGLEIMASPPGKRLQSLSLLSGGEQALTAMSLIFAVFITNPAPICVLDEVDAPLDDANVERFCDLLDDMVSRTQTRFLIVTHNAVTMSRVARLFGVTMPEHGVSQLVSVDLEQAEGMVATA